MLTPQSSDQSPEDTLGQWQPVYFAFNRAEAEYIVSYLDSSGIDADTDPDEEHPDCYWVRVPAPDVPVALQVVAHEREGKLDEKGIEAIRTAMGFSGGQVTMIAVWSLLILLLVLAAALMFRS